MTQPIIPVCIFAKPPVPGLVKTRLAPALGMEAAADLAAAMFRDVWQTVQSCPGLRPIWATSEARNSLLNISCEDIWLQGEGDLGARLERIFGKALLTGGAAIALGADSPTVTVTHLRRAIEALDTNDAVIGPAHDGGYYLLGLRRCPPGLLAGLAWSSSETALATRVRLRARGFSVAEIEPLFDIDTPEDLAILGDALFADSTLAPATRAFYRARQLMRV